MGPSVKYSSCLVVLNSQPEKKLGITMGKKGNSKAKDKKQERKANEKKMNAGVANCKLANAVEDPLSLLPKPFSLYQKNGLDLTLETVRAPQLDEATLVWAFNLVSTNMKPLYLAAYSEDADMDREFGWRRRRRSCGRMRPGTC